LVDEWRRQAGARIARLLCGAAVRSPLGDAVTMDTGVYRTEATGFAGLARLAGKLPTVTPRFIGLLSVLAAGVAAWVLLAHYGSNPAESEPARLATAAVVEPVQPSIPEGTGEGAAPNPAAAPAEMAQSEVAPVNGLKIASQSWRRGGLGSKALVTMTLRNGNDYAVKDIEIFCAFTRRDGSHLTDRRRMINETINMRSRKTFARMHVGFVNINANQAKCSLVTASRI